MAVNATIFSQVIGARLALYSVSNYLVAIDQLSRTTLRAVFGGLTLDDALSQREQVNTQLAGADGVGHRQMGHPYQPHRDRRRHATAADPPGHGPADEKIIIPVESAALLGAAQALRSVMDGVKTL